VAFTGAPTASEGWSYIEGPDWNLGPFAQWVQAKVGRTFSFAVGLFPSGMGITLAQVASGQHDSHYIALANNLARHGLMDADLRIGWEMDGGWYAWGAPAGSGKEASYVAAFRRVVTVMRQAQPGNKWKIMWNTTCDNWPNAAYLETIWPGADVVDIVGLDCYDQSFANGKVYYPAGSNRLQRQQEVWASLVARINVLRDMAVKYGKTMAFPEWALTNWSDGMGGGDNPYYIQKMYEFFMDPANRVVRQAYFNTGGSGMDHRLENYPQSAALYKQLFGAGSQ
jgi:Glycosyl hydrolase family 26